MFKMFLKVLNPNIAVKISLIVVEEEHQTTLGATTVAVNISTVLLVDIDFYRYCSSLRLYFVSKKFVSFIYLDYTSLSINH